MFNCFSSKQNWLTTLGAGTRLLLDLKFDLSKQADWGIDEWREYAHYLESSGKKLYLELQNTKVELSNTKRSLSRKKPKSEMALSASEILSQKVTSKPTKKASGRPSNKNTDEIALKIFYATLKNPKTKLKDLIGDYFQEHNRGRYRAQGTKGREIERKVKKIKDRYKQLYSL